MHHATFAPALRNGPLALPPSETPAAGPAAEIGAFADLPARATGCHLDKGGSARHLPACPNYAWCDAPWSSGRTGCPAVAA